MAQFALLVVLLLLVTQPARADQYDFVLQFNNATEMNNDSVVTQHSSDGLPLPDHTMLVAMTRISNGQDVPGTFILISEPIDLSALHGHAKLYLEIDRDKCIARQVGCIVQSHAGGGLLQDIQFSPVYMGADMPWGNLQ